MAQHSCHLKPFVAQDIMSRNRGRKWLLKSWSIGGWRERTAEKCWDKVLRHGEYHARSSGTEGEDMESNKQVHDEKIKKKKDDS